MPIRHRHGFTRTWPCIGCLLLLAALAGCSGEGSSGASSTTDSGPYTLNFAATDGTFSPHNGQLLSVAVMPSTGGAAVARDVVVVASGNFTFTFTDVLQAGTDYTVDYYADHNGGAPNGVCDTPAGLSDHGWRETLSVAAPATGGDMDTGYGYLHAPQQALTTADADTTVTVTHSTATFFSSVCASFPTRTLDFSGTGFPHSAIQVNVVRQPDGLKVVPNQQVTITAGSFTVAFTGMLQEGLSYNVDYYADVDSSGTCTTTDHVWRRSITAASTDTTLPVAHAEAFNTAACSSF
ncbi:MAG: hypothetical protein HY423_16165 [Candidatus Lambdaproteobacteria bacterium]|nr:hypothetical protein [Candidatus Lambdaproteobacteria bacterium]